MPPVIKLEDQLELLPTSSFPYAKYPFEKFNQVQSAVHQVHDKDCNIIIAAATSAGKAQPLYAPVLTPDGFTEMGNLVVGDAVIGSKGTPVKVTGVFPQGEKQVYRVHFSDDASVDCCADHLWAVQTRFDKYRKRPFRVKSLAALMDDLRTPDGQNKWYVPLIEPEVKSGPTCDLPIGQLNPFNIPRKAEIQGVGLSKGQNRSIDSVEMLDVDECQCIAVDALDHLYVTSDYVLTHNTICSEIISSYELRKNGGKALYLAPMRALAKEKIDDWSDAACHFGDLKLEICTGDYRPTPARKKALAAADIIVMTNEMLSSICRHYREDKHEYLKDVRTLVVDEVHLLGVKGRGDHAEVGIMKFTEINPEARLVFLSATMPNVKEIADWASYVLNGKQTYLIDSTYRPCPLGIHWEEYYDVGKYYEVEDAKVEAAMNIVQDYPDDTFLIFAHTKAIGQTMKAALNEAGIKAEFHSADLEKEKRYKIEDGFRKRDPRVIVATSTLAWGVNLPARRVIILGVHRGLNLVEYFDIWQEVGRAGRPQYDPRGDAYILLPERKFDELKLLYSTPVNITSRLLDNVNEKYKTLAFHLVHEIHQGDVGTKDDIHKWYERTLAHFQANDLNDQIVDSTIESLVKCSAIKLDPTGEDEKYIAALVGKVASMFYYSPFDVADLKRNFKYLFEQKAWDDIAISMMLGNTDSQREGYVSRAEADEMSAYEAKVRNIMGDNFTSEAIKGGYAYFTLLRGLNSPVFVAMARMLQFDSPRLLEVIKSLDSMGMKWNKQKWLQDLNIRLEYGVKDEMVPLCRLSGVGKTRAERLWAAGIKTPERILEAPGHAQKVMGLSDAKMAKVVESAQLTI